MTYGLAVIAAADIGVRSPLKRPVAGTMWEVPMGHAERLSQCWGVTGTVGGLVLSTVTTLGGMAPVVTWSIFTMLAAYRFLMPDYKIGMTETVNAIRDTKSKTRKVVIMGKSFTFELAKAALFTTLLNTVGLGALSL